MIVRSGLRTIERALRSVRPLVAEVCVLDTGSTGTTLDVRDERTEEPAFALAMDTCNDAGWGALALAGWEFVALPVDDR